MTKRELVKSMAAKMGASQKVAEEALDAFMDAVVESLGKGEEVNLIGFGKFAIKERAPKIGRNPKTGEEFQIPARKVPMFKVGQRLKEAVK